MPLMISLAFVLAFTLLMLLLIGLFPLFWMHSIYNKYREVRAVDCPENGQQVAVRFNARHAAVTALSSVPELRLGYCIDGRSAERARKGV